MTGPSGGKLVCPYCGSYDIEKTVYSFATYTDPKFFCRECKRVFDIPYEEIQKIQ